MARVQRPISPHILIYRWPIPAMLSIWHRMTGVALGAGSLLLIWWLVAAADGPEAFDTVQGILGSWFGRLVLFGFTVALFYHLCTGIRHLFWDLGYGFEIKTIYKSGAAVAVATVVLTALSWFVGLALWSPS